MWRIEHAGGKFDYGAQLMWRGLQAAEMSLRAAD